MVKKGSSDYKNVSKSRFFEEPLTEWFFVEPKMVLLWHRLKNLLKHLCDVMAPTYVQVSLLIVRFIVCQAKKENRLEKYQQSSPQKLKTYGLFRIKV